MKLYAAIDLHSTNNVTVVIDEQGPGKGVGCLLRELRATARAKR